MIRIGRWGLLPLGLALAFGLVTAATTIHVPDESVLAPLSGGGRLDYAGGPSERVEPLEDDFIRGILGRFIAAPRASLPRVVSIGGRAPVPHTPTPLKEDVPKPPDDLADARSISSVPYSGRTDAEGATRQPGVDPDDCSRVGGTLWFRYRPAAGEALIADTVGSDYATSLGVFVEDGGRLVMESCDSESSGWAVVDFDASGGKTYLFQISSQAQGGRLVFNLNRRGALTQASLNAAGDSGNDSSYHSALSADGRHIAFFSLATNLDGEHSSHCTAPPDPELMVEEVVLAEFSARACAQLYVRDRVTGRVTLASVSTSGKPGNGSSWWWSDISADGRYVAFQSVATDLVQGDTNGVADVFVRDLVAGRTERLSVNNRGEQASGFPWEADKVASLLPSISDDGRYVAFQSGASLVDGDTNGDVDVFVRDRLEGTTTRVSVSSAGRQKTGDYLPGPQRALWPCISPDGRLVRFASRSSNLVPADTNGFGDVFVHDRLLRTTERISISASGEQGDDHSGESSGRSSCFSADNRYVVYDSKASNLAGGDSPSTNSSGPKVLVSDRLARSVKRIGAGAENGGETGVISRNGRYVVLEWSPCSQANPVISCRGPLVWRFDLSTGFLEPLPVPEADDSERWGALTPDVSADGLVVALDWRWGGYVDRPVVFPPGTAGQVYIWERQGEAR